MAAAHCRKIGRAADVSDLQDAGVVFVQKEIERVFDTVLNSAAEGQDSLSAEGSSPNEVFLSVTGITGAD